MAEILAVKLIPLYDIDPRISLSMEYCGLNIFTVRKKFGNANELESLLARTHVTVLTNQT